MVSLVPPVCMLHTHAPVRICYGALLRGMNVFEQDVMLLCRNELLGACLDG